MALPPTIPTSFLPHPASAQRRFGADLGSTFAFVAYGLLVVALVLAVLVFIYARILAGSQASKDAQLAKAEAAIDPATVDTFVRLRDRLNSGEALLTSHMALTGFFDDLGTILPATVRFTALHISLDQTGAVKAEGTGVAKSFNALAATDAAFAKDGRIKDAIFSNISVNRDNSVSFSFTATLDSKLVTFTGGTGPSVPITTATTTTLTATTTP